MAVGATGTVTDYSNAIKSQAASDAAKAANGALPTTTANGTAIAGVGKSATTALAGNYETFIKLLTSQLQNQDPLAPTDTAAFTQQLVQYSQVEQQISTNSKLDSILGGITGQSGTEYVSYIGKAVEVSGDQLQLANKTATVGYSLPDAAKDVTIDILDKSKNVIATFKGDTTVGSHSYVWDGTMKDGSTVTDGAYTFKVTATGADGNALTNVTQSFTGLVTGVKASATGAMLDLNGMSVSPGNVLSIRGVSST